MNIGSDSCFLAATNPNRKRPMSKSKIVRRRRMLDRLVNRLDGATWNRYSDKLDGFERTTRICRYSGSEAGEYSAARACKAVN